MKYTGVFVVLLILITGCANSQGSLFVVLEGGDNIKLTPDPIVTAGEINLVQSPEISGNLSVDGDMFIRGEIVSVSDIQVNDSFNVSGDLQVGSTPALFVDSGSDSVGIGTTSPAGLLHLQTDDDLSFILKSGSSSNDDYRFVLDGGANTLAIGSTGHTSTLVLSGASGNVGIGTTSPAESLHVSGNVNITGNLLVEGCIIYNGATGSPTTLGSCV